jgi:hypothetical protein
MKTSEPKCPVCGRKGVAAGPDTYRCKLGHLFDCAPDEGGDYHDRDPSRRLERQEEMAKARRENLARRSQATGGFRFTARR